ncbi:MAG: replicative DNA helicase [Planctomycetia bacterium]|nr:replicative DNA helicase [Planctomycetia bacterium]
MEEKQNKRIRKRSEKEKTAELPSSGDLFDRMPPSSLEAEKNVVGAILLDPLICDEIALLLRPSDFYSDALRRIYTQLLHLHNSGSGIDLVLLKERLQETGELEEVGGIVFLAELMNSVQTVAHAVHYAGIVRDQAVRRDLIHASTINLQEAFLPQTPVRELVSQAEERIFAIGDSRSSNQVVSIEKVMQDSVSMIQRRSEGASDGVPTGFIDLDDLLGGLHPSELVILAARPSMGKTAFAANIAANVALQQKQPVLFFSLEMSKIELGIRFLCAHGKIKGSKLKGGTLSVEDNKKVVKAASALSESTLFFDDSPSRTVTEIGAMCRRIKRQSGSLALVVIDYLGLIEPDNAQDPRQEQVAKIARRLKGLAREMEVPILCLSQLNRMAEVTKDNRPRLSHLRESGAIEQDADVVMFVHREEYYHSREEAEDKKLIGKAEIIVAKQRNGPIGTVDLAWLGEYTVFTNMKKDADPGEYQEFNDYDDDFSGQSGF